MNRMMVFLIGAAALYGVQYATGMLVPHKTAGKR